MPSTTSVSADLPLDIRHPELVQLEAWLHDDRGSSVLLHGRRGVGKERLVETLIRRVQGEAGLVLLEGRTPEAGGRSFHPFAEIAQQALTWAEQAGLCDDVVDSVYDDLSVVLDQTGLDRDRTTSLDHKLRFFDSFRRLLQGIAERARILVVVYDLDRADGDTLELGHYLMEELFGDPDLDPDVKRPGLLVTVFRDDGPSARADAFRAEVMEGRTIRSMRLEGLDLDGLRRYVQSPHVLEKLLVASNGLPQEIDALIDALPNNVEELFARKLGGMDDLERDVLYALAVADRPTSVRALGQVTQHSPRQLAKTLSHLRDARIVDRKIHHGEFQFCFARRSDLEITANRMPTDVRADLHGRWAAAWAHGLEGAGTALVAHHQLRSPTPELGVTTALEAAEAYVVAGALRAAVELLESARPHAEGEAALSILNRLCELAPLTGHPQRALGYVQTLKEALPIRDRGIAFLREVELHNAAGDHARALEVLNEARAHTPQDNLLARAKVALAASEAYYHTSGLPEAAESSQEGLECLSAMNGEAPPRIRIELLNQLGKIALAADDPRRAIDFFRETLQWAETSGLESEEARALVNLGMAEMRHGDSRRAEQSLLLGIERARAAGDTTRLAFGYMNLGVLVHQCGELGRALGCYQECKSLFRRLGNQTQLARVLHNLGGLHLVLGDGPRARAYNDEALRLAAQCGVERLVAISTVVDGLIQAEQGELEKGESRLREGIRLLSKIGHERPLEALIELVQLKLDGEDVEGADELMTEVNRGLSQTDNEVLRARATYLRGLIQLARGEDALETLSMARDALEAKQRRLMVRDLDIALARAYLMAGRREQARMCLDSAGQIQSEMAEELPERMRQAFLSNRGQAVVETLRNQVDGKPQPQVTPPPPSVRPTAPQPPQPQWQMRYGAIVGTSAKLHRIFHILDRISQSEATVLINGESGTGKELVAEAIHKNSVRAEGPFIKLNCAALVESLLLSELFGHERGSFTGAHQRKIGRFEMAAGGTLFLDEIGDISPKTQVALLRVLQEREFERVGGGRSIRVEARIIFATNRNLAQMVKDGTFREDLYYRLKGLTIDLPPLRDRPEDIVALADHFLAEYAVESGSDKKNLSAGAVSLLSEYPWPGNVRELENIVRSVALFAENPVMTERDFDEYLELFQTGPQLRAGAASSPPARVVEPSTPPVPAYVAPSTSSAVPAPAEPAPSAMPAPVEPAPPAGSDPLFDIFSRGIPLPELKKRIQTQAIARALQMTEGNITRAAEVLGMRRPRLSQIINADENLKALCQGASR